MQTHQQSERMSGGRNLNSEFVKSGKTAIATAIKVATAPKILGFVILSFPLGVIPTLSTKSEEMV